MNIKNLSGFLAVVLFSAGVFAKLPPTPPAPPLDPVAVAAKAEKDKVAAEKGKALQVAAEERAVKNYQANMKKAGKPIPKPTPILVVAAAATPGKPGAATTTPRPKVPESAARK